MRKKKNLRSLQMLANGRENRWQRHVADQLRTLRTEEQRLEQLREFIDEYEQPQTTAGGSQSILTMRTQRQFVDRLNAALKKQNETVGQQRQQARRGMDRWRKARSEQQALEKFAEKLEKEDGRRRDRRAQAFLDEVGRFAFLTRSR